MTARLPVSGGDNNNWGTILNDYLSVSHEADGSIKDEILDEKLDKNSYHFINALDWPGITGNGADDQTEAIQSLFDWVIGGDVAHAANNNRRASHYIYFPRGGYRITAPLKIYSVIGFVLFGAGNETVFRWSGDYSPGSRVFDINGIRASTFENFDVVGHNLGDPTEFPVDAGISVQWRPAESQLSTTNNLFRKIRVRNLMYKIGWDFGTETGSLDLSSISLYECRAQGNNALSEDGGAWYIAGFSHGSGQGGNILNHYHFHSLSHYNQVAIWSNSCTTYVHGCVCSGSKQFDFRQTGQRQMVVDNLRSETSAGLFEMVGSGTAAAQSAISNIRWATNVDYARADGEYIRIGTGGTFTFNNVYIQPTNPHLCPPARIKLQASRDMMVNINGLITPAAVEDLFIGTGPARITMTAYAKVEDDNQNQIEKTIPLWVKNHGTGAVPATSRATFGEGIILGASTGPQIRTGTGSPEGSVTAPVGSLYLRTSGGNDTTLYAKTSGTGNTGWRVVQTAAP